MLKSLGNFRVSLLELFLLVTGFGIGFALFSMANLVVSNSLQYCLVIVLLISLSLAIARPDRRASLLSFVGGTLLFQWCAGVVSYDDFPRPLLEYLYEKTVSSERQNVLWGEGYFVSIATLELSLLAGVFCAWLTRSFSPSNNSVKTSEPTCERKPRLLLRDWFWLALVLAILCTWWLDHFSLLQSSKEIDPFGDNPFE